MATRVNASRQLVRPLKGKRLTSNSQTSVDVAFGVTNPEDWDDEELQYGRRRDKNGNLCGRPPSFIPKACHDELVRRTLYRASRIMEEGLTDVVEELVNIAKGDSFARQDQVRAINMMLERVMGKPVEHVQLQIEQPWKKALVAGIVGEAEDIVEAEVVEDDDEDDDVSWE